MKRLVVAVLSVLVASCASAQVCPKLDESLANAREKIRKIVDAGFLPFAARCADERASIITLDEDNISDPNVIEFFRDAGYLYRKASDIRKKTGLEEDAARFLDKEIALRKAWIDVALRPGAKLPQGPIRKATIIHVSERSSALALRQRFKDVDEFLSDVQPTAIDEVAVGVWLQALYSCNSFDGLGSLEKLCRPENTQACGQKISYFFEAIEQMTGRVYPRRLERDIAQLKEKTKDAKCLATQ